MDLDLYSREADFSTPEGVAALEIYSQDLFLSKSLTEIEDEIEGLSTFVYSSDDRVIGVASIDFSEDYMGKIVLEYMAVDKEKQHRGFGGAILDIIKSESREVSGSHVKYLYVTVQSDTADFYVENGAIEDEDGSVYFELDD